MSTPRRTRGAAAAVASVGAACAVRLFCFTEHCPSRSDERAVAELEPQLPGWHAAPPRSAQQAPLCRARPASLLRLPLSRHQRWLHAAPEGAGKRSMRRLRAFRPRLLVSGRGRPVVEGIMIHLSG